MDRIAWLVLIPYLMWVSFATCLNAAYWWLNFDDFGFGSYHGNKGVNGTMSANVTQIWWIRTHIYVSVVLYKFYFWITWVYGRFFGEVVSSASSVTVMINHGDIQWGIQENLPEHVAGIGMRGRQRVFFKWKKEKFGFFHCIKMPICYIKEGIGKK